MKRRNRGRRDELDPGNAQTDIMTIHHVADYLKLHYIMVYRLVKTRRLPAFRLGSDFRVRRSDLEKWIAERRVPARESKPTGNGRKS